MRLVDFNDSFFIDYEFHCSSYKKEPTVYGFNYELTSYYFFEILFLCTYSFRRNIRL